MVSGDREWSQKYVTMETKSRDLREDRGLRVRVVGFICEFHLGEQVLFVLLEAAYEAWGVCAAGLSLRRDDHNVAFDDEGRVIHSHDTMEAI